MGKKIHIKKKKLQKNLKKNQETASISSTNIYITEKKTQVNTR